ncbi:hypothetical protein [Pseudomonas sp.]|uniref:tetratricopeptide repeat protein n=1 Tax=Pseudomonas sp. TaxID=306 RepID=UPI0028AD4B6A|nr:hypothetical protein [Pseudomonas sp.]
MHKWFFSLLGAVAIAGCQSDPQSTSQRFQNTYEERIAAARCLLFTGQDSVDPEELLYIKAHALEGNEGCMAVLGMMYRQGTPRGVTQDLSESRALFTRLSKTEPSANAVLGLMAEQGEGEPVDYAKARKLYRLSGDLGATGLGRLLEAGHGGAQDLPGAMAAYLDGMRQFGDEGWEGMARLRKQGLALDDRQKQQYQRIWVRELQARLHRAIRVPDVLDAIKASEGTGRASTAKLRLTFTANSGKPETAMAVGSGNAELDASILRAVATLSMGEFAPFTDQNGQLKVDAPLGLALAG